MPHSRDELLMVAEMTVRHLAARMEEPPKVFPGLIQSTSGGVAQFLQDGARTSVPVTNKNLASNTRALVQFNPSGSAFTVQAV